VTAILRWLWPPAAPSVRELPEALLRAALFGVVVGLPLSFMFTPASVWRYVGDDPLAWVLRASAVGATFSVCFYLACGLPVSYILKADTDSRRSWLVPTVAIVGAVLGGIAALLVFRINGSTTPETARLVVIGAALAVLLTLMLTAWYRLQSDKEVADARARQWSLQAQINPHFFFNTLNTITALIKPNPDAAERMVGLLADMSRYSFGNEARMVPLHAELDFAEKYLEIERERFGERLSWSLPPAEHVRGLTLPPLTLQPLVENAVRHGVARRIHGGTISIALRRAQTDAVISVTNPVDETPAPGDLFRQGHALWNIRERLQLTYGSRASLAVIADDSTVTVVISVPAAQ
jgi:LytS/YehU family sensor histidine kinase